MLLLFLVSETREEHSINEDESWGLLRSLWDRAERPKHPFCLMGCRCRLLPSSASLWRVACCGVHIISWGHLSSKSLSNCWTLNRTHRFPREGPLCTDLRGDRVLTETSMNSAATEPKITQQRENTLSKFYIAVSGSVDGFRHCKG